MLRRPTKPLKPSSPLPLDPDRRAGLWRAKLRALARDHLNRVDGADHALPWGAALEIDGAWTILVENDPERSFSQALVFALRNGAREIDLLVDADGAGAVARRAELFEPSPRVWAVHGTELRPASPVPLLVQPVPELRDDLAHVLAMPEVRTIVEHGVITGECRGVEVARITGEGAEQRLDVGVGAYDQGAFAVMNPDLSPTQALAEVVAQVLTHRRSGAAPHPINRLVRERWLRSDLIDDPSPLGVAELLAVEGPTPRDGLYDRTPAFAVAVDRSLVVACSVGIDLDLVPAAAEVASREAADRIVLVLPERDQHGATLAVAERCRLRVDVVTAAEPWPVG